MDSSAITAMVRAVQGPEIPLHTFSYVAEDPELSEERWSGMVARAMAAKQHLVHIHPNELVEDFRELVRVQEQPFGSPTIYAQYRIFRSVHEAGVKSEEHTSELQSRLHLVCRLLLEKKKR